MKSTLESKAIIEEFVGGVFDADCLGRQSKTLASFRKKVPKVNKIFDAYEFEVKCVKHYNDYNESSTPVKKQISPVYLNDMCLHMNSAALKKKDDFYLFEADTKYDFTDPGMQSLLVAFLKSIPNRDKSVSLNFQSYLMAGKHSIVLELLLCTLKTNCNELKPLNVREIWLSGDVSAIQLGNLMKLLDGTNIQALHLNYLSNVNFQHMQSLSKGLEKGCPLLSVIELEFWNKSDKESYAPFAFQFGVFMNKLRTHCKGLSVLSFFQNHFITPKHASIELPIRFFLEQNPSCGIFAPQFGLNGDAVVSTTASTRSISMETSTTPLQYSDAVASTTASTRSISMEPSTTPLQYGSFFVPKLKSPWIDHQKEHAEYQTRLLNFFRGKELLRSRLKVPESSDQTTTSSVSSLSSAVSCTTGTLS